MGKRGQITLFIIIGILVLMIGGLVYSVSRGLIPGMGIPNEIRDLKVYTDACVAQIAQEGLDIMAVQGGYIEFPKRFEQESFIDHGYRIPYWYYKGDSRIPTRKMMSQQLATHMQKNLPICLDNFSLFRGRYDVDAEEINVSASIRDNAVSFTINYPLHIKLTGQDKSYYLERFGIDMESNLGKMHDLAVELMNLENRNSFLENYTDEMIACSDWLPYEGMEFSCAPKHWLVKDMLPYIQTMIMHNLHFLMFENTLYEKTGMPYYDKQYLVSGIKGGRFRKIKVNAIYNPAWPTTLEVLPSKDGVVKPLEFKIVNYIGTCVKVYHHKYTMEYPVVFQLVDTENPGAPFFFATPVIIKRNLPNRYNEVEPWPEEIDAFGSEQYCANRTKITQYSLSPEGKILTSPQVIEQRRNSLSVYVVDSEKPDEPMPGVEISYQCVQFRCDIGRTDYTRDSRGMLESPLASLTARFPDCEGGILIAEKPGYLRAREQVTVDDEANGAQITLEMKKLKQFKYEVRVIEDHNGLITERGLVGNESTVITIKNQEARFEETVIYPVQDDYFSNLSLPIADMPLQVDIKLVRDDRYLGGLALNWTPDLEEMRMRNHIIFTALKKDTMLANPTPEDFQMLMEYTKSNSERYPPLLR